MQLLPLRLGHRCVSRHVWIVQAHGYEGAMAWESGDGKEVEGKSSQDDLVALVGRGQNQKLRVCLVARASRE
jgi:hypothetical protein